MDLEEQPGSRLNSNILESNVKNVRISMPVEITFEERIDDVTLPQFRPQRG